jgi:hypothetical protein
MMDDSAKDRDRLLQIARAFLNCEISMLEAAYKLSPIMRRHPELASGDDFRFIVGIDSETDDLPVGPVRKLWDEDALREKDREIERCEKIWGAEFREICERILLRSQSVQ